MRKTKKPFPSFLNNFGNMMVPFKVARDIYTQDLSMRNDMNLLVINDNRMRSRDSFVLKQILISLHFISFSWNLSKTAREAKVSTAVWPHPEIFCFGLLEDSLRASSPVWASETGLARTRERAAGTFSRSRVACVQTSPISFVARVQVLARLASLAQIGELARRLTRGQLLRNNRIIPAREYRSQTSLS